MHVPLAQTQLRVLAAVGGAPDLGRMPLAQTQLRSLACVDRERRRGRGADGFVGAPLAQTPLHTLAGADQQRWSSGGERGEDCVHAALAQTQHRVPPLAWTGFPSVTDRYVIVAQGLRTFLWREKHISTHLRAWIRNGGEG